jgi:hypothetical protein
MISATLLPLGRMILMVINPSIHSAKTQDVLQLVPHTCVLNLVVSALPDALVNIFSDLDALDCWEYK